MSNLRFPLSVWSLFVPRALGPHGRGNRRSRIALACLVAFVLSLVGCSFSTSYSARAGGQSSGKSKSAARAEAKADAKGKGNGKAKSKGKLQASAKASAKGKGKGKGGGKAKGKGRGKGSSKVVFRSKNRVSGAGSAKVKGEFKGTHLVAANESRAGTPGPSKASGSRAGTPGPNKARRSRAGTPGPDKSGQSRAGGGNYVKSKKKKKKNQDKKKAEEVEVIDPPETAPDNDFGYEQPVRGCFEGIVYPIGENAKHLPKSYSNIDPVSVVYACEWDIPTRDWSQGFPGVEDFFEWFAIRYEGKFSISTPGKWKFRISSDDGSKLYIDGKLVIDNDGTHPPKEKSGVVELDKGDHEMVLEYFQGPRYHINLQLYATPPGGEEGIFSVR